MMGVSASRPPRQTADELARSILALAGQDTRLGAITRRVASLTAKQTRDLFALAAREDRSCVRVAHGHALAARRLWVASVQRGGSGLLLTFDLTFGRPDEGGVTS